MNLIKNENYTLYIHDIAENGFGVGKIDNFTIFVNGALPDETVLIKIIKIKKSYAYGKIIEIIKKSQYRREPFCEVFNKCGGCSLQHFDYNEGLRFKTKLVKDNIERIGGLSNINVLNTIGMNNPFNYRNKAIFPVAFFQNNLSIGFFAPRSHNVIDISKCYIQDPINEKIISVFRNFMSEFNIPPYDEINHRGIIRNIMTRTASATGEVMICIVINGKKLPQKDFIVDSLSKIKGVSSILLCRNSSKTNTILNNDISVLFGKSFISDYIGEFMFKISPLSFFQINPVQTLVLYQTALDFAELTGKETVIDAYCGIGTISLFISKKAKKVFGVEVVPDAISNAKENATFNNIHNAEFILGKAEDVIPDLYKSGLTADVLFLDPPRKGCDFKLIQLINEVLPDKIIYISCNPSTLARDLKILSQKYNIIKVQPVDMFCFTSHVETVVLMSCINI